ncbi:MAG: RpiB/LacA/LacB family sugar-phosphate isomerase [Acidimicrobiia bacterium]|nr:RpiB/LacA/LacB family sugar-phosphate isomerase [Acidimicrobiia bacterium]
MHIVFGADHAGFPLKETLIRAVADAGYSVEDLGTHTTDPVDYPDFAAAVAREVAAGRADKGVVVCGSGAGAAIAANKVRGVRAAVAHDTYTAHQMVEHDDANVITLGSRVVGPRGPPPPPPGQDHGSRGGVGPRQAPGLPVRCRCPHHPPWIPATPTVSSRSSTSRSGCSPSPRPPTSPCWSG